MRVVFVLIAVQLLSWNAQAAKLRVLFVGNSMTYVNDLPRTFARVAKSLGDDVETDMSALGGYSLQQHASNPDTLAKIHAGGWDDVVLQEHSPRMAAPADEVERQVMPFALQLDKAIHEAHGRTLLLENYAREDGDPKNCRTDESVCSFEGMQANLVRAYRDLAKRTSAGIVPVAAAWTAVRAKHPEIVLYQGDGIHPTRNGTYLMACVFYASLFKKPVLAADNDGVAAPVAAILRQAAQDAVRGMK